MIENVHGIIREFKAKSGIQRIYLIGSQAAGDATQDSDIDLVLVDGRFEGKRSFERPVGLRRWWPKGIPVDFICLTPKEFEERRKRASLARLAEEEGIVFS